MRFKRPLAAAGLLVLLVAGLSHLAWGQSLKIAFGGAPEPRTQNPEPASKTQNPEPALKPQNPKPLKPGTEVFAVDPGRVLEVSYRSAGLHLLAHRWNVREGFTLVFLDQGQPRPAVCPAGPAFATVLGQVTSLKLVRTLDAAQAKACFQKNPLPSWAELMIRDDSELDPFQARILPVAGSPAEALVHFHGATYVVAFDHQVFRLISGGCRSLGTGG